MAPSAIRRYSPDLEFFLTIEEGGRRGDKKEVFDEKCSPPRTAKASNLGRGWNFTWDGQAGLGHPHGGGGGGGRQAERLSAKGKVWGF